jgi:hypothetical protein
LLSGDGGLEDGPEHALAVVRSLAVAIEQRATPGAMSFHQVPSSRRMTAWPLMVNTDVEVCGDLLGDVADPLPFEGSTCPGARHERSSGGLSPPGAVEEGRPGGGLKFGPVVEG